VGCLARRRQVAVHVVSRVCGGRQKAETRHYEQVFSSVALSEFPGAEYVAGWWAQWVVAYATRCDRDRAEDLAEELGELSPHDRVTGRFPRRWLHECVASPLHAIPGRGTPVVPDVSVQGECGCRRARRFGAAALSVLRPPWPSSQRFWPRPWSRDAPSLSYFAWHLGVSNTCPFSTMYRAVLSLQVAADGNPSPLRPRGTIDVPFTYSLPCFPSVLLAHCNSIAEPWTSIPPGIR
jgi:hypothetical protein